MQIGMDVIMANIKYTKTEIVTMVISISLYRLSGGRYPFMYDIIDHVKSFWEIPDRRQKERQNVYVRYEVNPTLNEWLKENAKYYVHIQNIPTIYFYRKQDAILFKLTWG